MEGRRAAPRLSNDPRVRGAALQVAIVLTVLGLVGFFANNAAQNLADQGMTTGFGFLTDSTQWDLSDRVIPHKANDPYYVTFAVGITNTLYVSLIGIAIVTVLGTLLGIARVSKNWLAARLAGLYVECFRNTPLLLQILFWYTLLRNFPPPKRAEEIFSHVYLTNRGAFFPAPDDIGYLYALCGLIVGIVASIVFARYARHKTFEQGKSIPTIPVVLLLMVGVPVIVWAVSGAPLEVDIPRRGKFNIEGGWSFTPEFVALLMGLVAYYTAFVGEVVRGGIEGVDYGQKEAAQSIGLRNSSILRYIILPQALRIIIPPLANQYMALLRNSSLGVAIGFPELFTVGTISVNQMGQAIEVITLIMMVYLLISFVIAAVMNFINRRVAFVS